ncbi:MAG: carboxylating nicotinate-nucleotide diphosphorylase [Bacteroidales bacterium]|nr:carboxylating nicotinate-nucleotide diphosphorylase [Bacteroidales bacterium]
MNREQLDQFIEMVLAEDVGDGDHSSLAVIDVTSMGEATLLAKDTGIIAGVEVARLIFDKINSSILFNAFLPDGANIYPGDKVFTIKGQTISILKGERLVLNIMQRMSGIATTTRKYADAVAGFKASIVDTRKTYPGMRFLEKEAVRIGGGTNHRMGLYDMIMLKDNHIDYAGGIQKAIEQTHKYLKENNLSLKIEVEARNLEEVKEIMKVGGVDRIMLDNFNIPQTEEAVAFIAGRFEIESSGSITLDNVCEYAACGVDLISIGALTHQLKSLDLSLKASW